MRSPSRFLPLRAVLFAVLLAALGLTATAGGAPGGASADEGGPGAIVLT